MPASSATVSLVEAISLVTTAATQKDDHDKEAMGAVIAWCESEEGRQWLQGHVVESKEFVALCNDKEASVEGILERGLQGLEELDEEAADDGGGAPPPMPAAASVLKYVLTAKDVPNLAEALERLKRQLPMIASLQKTLGLLPPEFAKMVDANAAKMGEAVRAQQKEQGGKPVAPHEVLQTVLNNPAFAEMMTAMMEQGEGPDEEAHARERAADARQRVLEHRVTELEARLAQLGGGGAPPKAPSNPVKGGGKRNKKTLGGRTNSHTPTY